LTWQCLIGATMVGYGVMVGNNGDVSIA